MKGPENFACAPGREISGLDRIVGAWRRLIQLMHAAVVCDRVSIYQKGRLS